MVLVQEGNAILTIIRDLASLVRKSSTDLLYHHQVAGKIIDHIDLFSKCVV
jgi:hypothetical protein